MRISRLLLACASIFISAMSADLSPCRADDGKYFQAPPAPLRWAQAPHARTSSTVIMTVESVGQAESVEYLFDCVSGDAHDSAWQDSPTYTDSGLKPDTEYAYVVKARDKASKKPCYGPSPAVSVRTRSDGKGSGVGHVAAIDKALADGKLERIPIMVTGPTANRINIVAINRWTPGSSNPYNKPELREEFIADSRHVLKAFDAIDEVAIDPYPAYRNFFNVYAVWWPDMPPWNPNDRKTGMHWDDYNEIRARLFLPWRIEGKGWVTHLAMVNSDSGGGGAGRKLDERVGDAMIAGNEIEAFIHEFNHTAPGCPDEYTSSGLWGRGGEALTTTNEHRSHAVNWRAWIEPGTPVPTPYSSKYIDKVGLFEGGVHRMAHLYRPTARGCIMGAGSFAGDAKGMCPACRQGAVQRFYHWVQAVDRVQPAQESISIEGPRTVRFAASRIKPDPDTQKTEWRLNGRVIATGVDEVDVTFGALPEYELVFSLTDETPFIRPDPPYSRYPTAETRWKITNTKPAPKGKPLTISLTARPPVFSDVQDGAITAEVTGGQAPYTYAWSDGASLRDRTGLAPGRYELRVADSEFRVASAAADIDRAANIDTSLNSEFRDGAWQIAAEGAKDKSVTAIWSTGAKGARVEKLPDGAYTCTLHHAGGNEVTRSVTLVKPSEPLTVKAGEVVPVTGGENNGSVSLVVCGGREAYSFTWSDGAELATAGRHFMPAGSYTVTVRDSNFTTRTLSITVGREPHFIASKLSLTKVAPGRVKVAGAAEGSRYLWFADDYPPHLPRFPHGIYTGTFTMPNGQKCQAEAYVIQNKGGLFIDEARRDRNDYGFWIHARAFVGGRAAEPLTVEVQTTSKGTTPRELVIQDQQVGDLTWFGEVSDGRLVLRAKNSSGNDFRLLYASHPDEPDKPLCAGDEFSPPKSGNYFVAVQNAKTGAISNNRVGFAITVGGSEPEAKLVAPNKAGSAKLLMWLDASDVDGDGNADAAPPRRGSIMGWQGKAGGVDFNEFIYYLPNTQNGLGVASWKTIWLQSISKEVSGYQTIFMVRKEHDLSSVGTSPWRDLSGLIGVGEYGKRLMSRDVSDDIRRGAVHVNGRKVDPFKEAMPTDFYVATYEFPEPVSKAFRRTDGHWEGQLAEVLVFDGKLSDSERAGIEQYLRRKWLSAASSATAEGQGKSDRRNPGNEAGTLNRQKANMHLCPEGKWGLGEDKWGKIVRVNMLKITAADWAEVPGVKKAWPMKGFEGVEGMAFHPIISEVKDVDRDGKLDIFRCRSEHPGARIERLRYDDGSVVWESEPLGALHGDESRLPVFDLHGAGRFSVLHATKDGTWCINADTGKTEWTARDGCGDIIVGHFLDRKTQAVVVRDEGVLRCYDHTGKKAWTHDTKLRGGAAYSHEMGRCDVDGDGLDEIFANWQKLTMGLRGDGAVLWEDRTQKHHSDFVDYGDVDGDGKIEVIYDHEGCNAAKGPIYVVEPLTGRIRSRIDYRTQGVRHAQNIALGNFDKTHRGLEIAFCEKGSNIYLFNAAGKLLWKRPVPASLLSKGDWDGDGDDEVFAFGLGANVDGMFSVWDGDGRRLYAISFLPSPYNRFPDDTRDPQYKKNFGGSWRAHAMPGGHEGIRRQVDLDNNGRADVIMPFGEWHWGSDSILFLMEGQPKSD